eukprot:3376369-Amphidinium_carterae.4
MQSALLLHVSIPSKHRANGNSSLHGIQTARAGIDQSHSATGSARVNDAHRHLTTKKKIMRYALQYNHRYYDVQLKSQADKASMASSEQRGVVASAICIVRSVAHLGWKSKHPHGQSSCNITSRVSRPRM